MIAKTISKENDGDGILLFESDMHNKGGHQIMKGMCQTIRAGKIGAVAVILYQEKKGE